MPQSSDELRREMELRFGDIDTFGPSAFLKERGYNLTDRYLWEPKPGGIIQQDEWDCIQFLQEEWDYGGLTRPMILAGSPADL